MAFVRNAQGVVGQVPDTELDKALKSGYTSVSEDEVAAERANAAKDKEAADHPLQTFGEQTLKGAVDMFTAPARAAGGVLETAIGSNPVSDTLGYMTGDNALAATKSLSQGFGPSQEQNDANTDAYMQDVGRRSAANPVSSFAGGLVGGAAGMGPAMALAGPAGSAVEKAVGGTAGRLGGAFVEGGTVVGTSSLAAATDEAHFQGSYLRGEQALAAGGLGFLLGGGLNLVGRAFGDLYKMHAEAKLGPRMPDLEVPPEATSVTERTAFPTRKDPGTIPDLDPGGWSAKDSEALVSSGPAFEKTEPGLHLEEGRIPAAAREETTNPGGRIKSTPEEVTAKAAPALEEPVTKRATTPALEAPSTKPDMSLGGLSEDVKPTEVPRAAPKDDVALNVEMRKDLVAEDLHMRARLDKVDKLAEHLPPLTTSKDVLAMAPADIAALADKAGVSKISPSTLEALAQAADDRNAGAYQGSVKKILDIIPPGATPDYVLDLSKKEREALADFVGVTRHGPATWRAVADGIAEREGIQLGEPTAHLPPPAELAPPEPAAQPKFPTPGDYKPGAGAESFTPEPAPTPKFPPANAYKPGAGAESFTPEAPPQGASVLGSGQPYTPPAGGGGTPAQIGESGAGEVASGAGISPPKAGSGKSGWSKFVNQVVRQSARRVAGRAVGGVIGGAVGFGVGGPVGAAVGAAGAEMLGGAAYDRLGGLAAKSAKLASKAVSGALELGMRTPESIKMAGIARAASSFYKANESPEASYQSRMKQLRAFKSSPDLLTQRIAEAFGPMAQYEKGAVLASVHTSQRGIDYLLQVAPKGKPDINSLTPMSSATTPNRSDLAEFSRVYGAVMHPKTVLADIENGSVTASQIEAIKNVYPQWYQENIVSVFGDKLRAKDAAGQTILPIERKVADVSLGVHSGVESNDFVDKYGDKFTQALAAQQPQPQKQGGKSRKLSHPSGLTARMQTQTDSILGPIQ